MCHWQHNMKHEHFSLWGIASVGAAMLLTKQTSSAHCRTSHLQIYFASSNSLYHKSDFKAWSISLCLTSIHICCHCKYTSTQLSNIILQWGFRKYSSPHYGCRLIQSVGRIKSLENRGDTSDCSKLNPGESNLTSCLHACRGFLNSWRHFLSSSWYDVISGNNNIRPRLTTHCCILQIEWCRSSNMLSYCKTAQQTFKWIIHAKIG